MVLASASSQSHMGGWQMMEDGEHNYSIVFNFEKLFDEPSFMEYMLKNWTNCFIYSVIYIVLIFGGQCWMKARNRFDLRPALAVWSGTLALFSIAGAIRTLPELISTIRNRSLQYSICVPTYFRGVTSFWAYMFTVSKVFELGDTLFIVLRKQQLIFLHWYHHIATLIYVWYSYTDHTAPGRWFMVMNYIVHSIMYTYYALRAMRIYLPVVVNMTVTSLQILQMVVGCLINYWSFQIKTRGEYCNQSYDNIKYSTLMYCSYFFLFAHFFYNAYIRKQKLMKKVS
ncbi:elongation of very long chain fatty acids protein 6-like [Octopus vulgaris]|uniref:Elongation of very long chain fatty acids protein 6-like n=2 Tax=Octopus TaxID=6643 RepID=A0AA36F8V1_OCTVU|nr:elongation of very long chain fatty acids protein 6-like [Octopus sinensis]XP_036360936.1 elongation of very long chain fatty acids protein 6-like [Octopus sinensis]XP_036360937.1 elongation of very long chain fatty acids protein 6-like [Octopus sinensis]XP_036360938.1 elongation of very long chain fatty acids protein 6-like [Octopus sinensis]XP_036360939.1 elongation of very long chain fatty acids protein 6-like [Octopus sinensis]XP_036360940.1 elongation of very long chain fatty acids pro